jgi:hypothetical protein
MEIIEIGLSVPERPPDGLSASLAGNDAEAVALGFGREARRDEPGREGTLHNAD